MNDPMRKGAAIALGPEEGLSFWQPRPSNGYVTVKISPYNSPNDLISAGIQVLEPGASVRRHAHERANEILFVYEGEGKAQIDGQWHRVSQGSTLMVGRFVEHYVENDGARPLKLFWAIMPAGLEDWFQALGRPRTPGEPLPEPFDRPQNVEEIQHRMRFA
ncbi:MAG TPA: cupin domain-containing protein [Burkholderiales bacterium]|jgi:quercetin dioxygenase-like cupin family protein|nr:cupin domain-containing protein [Burkholderiales bacterium]